MDTTKKTETPALPDTTPTPEQKEVMDLINLSALPQTEEEMQEAMSKMLGLDFAKMQTDPMSFFRDLKAKHDELEKLRLDMSLTMRLILDLIDVFGLLDEQKKSLRQTIIDGKEDPIPAILGQITQLVTIDAPMAKFNKRKREELEQRFKFMQYISLIVGKYDPAPKSIYDQLKPAV